MLGNDGDFGVLWAGPADSVLGFSSVASPGWILDPVAGGVGNAGAGAGAGAGTASASGDGVGAAAETSRDSAISLVMRCKFRGGGTFRLIARFPPNITLPLLEKDRVLKSSKRLSAGMWVVIGVNSCSSDRDDEVETRSSLSLRGRGGDDFGGFSEPRAGGTSGDAALSSVRLFFRKRLVDCPVRKLNVLPSLCVKDVAREGGIGSSTSAVADSTGDPARDSIGDSTGVSGVAARSGIVKRPRGAEGGAVDGQGLGDAFLTLGWSSEKRDDASISISISSTDLGNSVSSSYSSWIVIDDAVGARPESLFQSSLVYRDEFCVRKRGCSS